MEMRLEVVFVNCTELHEIVYPNIMNQLRSCIQPCVARLTFTGKLFALCHLATSRAEQIYSQRLSGTKHKGRGLRVFTSEMGLYYFRGLIKSNVSSRLQEKTWDMCAYYFPGTNPGQLKKCFALTVTIIHPCTDPFIYLFNFLHI